MLCFPNRSRLVVMRLRGGRVGSFLDADAAATRLAGIQAIQLGDSNDGRRARTRTWDPLLRRQMLYPTELRARSILIVVQPAPCIRLSVPPSVLNNPFRCQGIDSPLTITRPDLPWLQLVRKPVRDVIDKRWY